jgi:hypothetical protein
VKYIHDCRKKINIKTFRKSAWDVLLYYSVLVTFSDLFKRRLWGTFFPFPDIYITADIEIIRKHFVVCCLMSKKILDYTGNIQ